MKKLIFLISMVSLFFYCGPKQEKVEKFIEDGMEVVINHIEPYKIKGEPSTLNLEEEFTIDTEKDEMAEIGLVDINNFDVDSEGSIYFIQWRTSGNYIYKFDNNGNFIKSFCHWGQGPGEIEWGGTVMITPQGELIAKDPSKTKYLVFNTEGDLLREVFLKSHLSILKIFGNGKYLVFWQDNQPGIENFINHLGLCEFGFENIKEFYTYAFPNPMLAEKIYTPGNFWVEGASEARIFIGDGKLGYEIMVFDLEGNLIRKIRKEYSSVELSEEYRRNFLERRKSSPFRDKYEFRKYWPPFQYLFTDEDGRIFVMTYEKGAYPNEWIYDIFTQDGVFIGRTTIKNRMESRALPIKVKHNRIYSICEKESGYKELVVYKTSWE